MSVGEEAAPRSQEWLGIWQNKYRQNDQSRHLHVLDGYDAMSYEEWQRLVGYFIDKLNIGPHDDVMEVGCGCGAFLKEVPPCGSLSGVDYSENAISAIRQNLVGTFETAEAAALPFDDDAFDAVLSFGVFLYFDSLDYARQVVSEMHRVCRPGGTIFVGEVNDLAKRDLAEQARNASRDERSQKHVSPGNPDQIYCTKDFFRDFASDNGLEVAFYDGNVPELEFYYNAAYRFSVVMSS